MGLFSKKSQQKPPTPRGWTPPPLPEIGPQQLAEASSLMKDWTRIVGRASDAVFWDAVTRFARIGGAVEPAEQIVAAIHQNGGSATAIYERPWQRWLEIGSKAYEAGDLVLPCRIFFFAWTIREQVRFGRETFDIAIQQPEPGTFQAIARQALFAVNSAPLDFVVVERTDNAPVTRRTLQMGLSQVLGIEPPPEEATPTSLDGPFNEYQLQRANPHDCREHRVPREPRRVPEGQHRQKAAPNGAAALESVAHHPRPTVCLPKTSSVLLKRHIGTRGGCRPVDHFARCATG
ncbi:hypothetical protein U2F26_31590 [Micromonospora sp. 4G57]|uniref:Uncharacterized protein n=1 Tax=Micromonospora sicca TaxID=2202420 RepID=A0ABU5JMR7_9ACTN|nr:MULTISPECIES: hypothetical protein [unclassified Micromonospora]MDZ5447204.1 hypothetical protein [Micromonospora sp. 4G57]MDZ5493929.1 hypothetical protein [Micromonospora sp. 4G53]